MTVKKPARLWLFMLGLFMRLCLFIWFLFLLAAILTGCASLLERQYSSVEPHSSKFWESEAAGTLRAETYSDVVNDLLLLIGQHRENATLRIYNTEPDGAEMLEKAAVEMQQETALGSYAVAYITFSSQTQRGYDEAKIQIGYRRTAEQIQAIVNATSPAAVYSLLETALEEGRTELVVRIGYWGQNGQEQVEEAVSRLWEERNLFSYSAWPISYYPPDGPVGLIEFDLALEPLPETGDDNAGAADDITSSDAIGGGLPDSIADNVF